MTADEAIGANKLRFGACAPIDGWTRAGVTARVWPLARARRPAPGLSQDETWSWGPPARGDGGWTLVVEICFDHDFCSLYDQTERDTVTVWLPDVAAE